MNEEILQLAQKLQQSGIARSKMDAIKMAESMITIKIDTTQKTKISNLDYTEEESVVARKQEVRVETPVSVGVDDHSGKTLDELHQESNSSSVDLSLDNSSNLDSSAVSDSVENSLSDQTPILDLSDSQGSDVVSVSEDSSLSADSLSSSSSSSSEIVLDFPDEPIAAESDASSVTLSADSSLTESDNSIPLEEFESNDAKSSDDLNLDIESADELKTVVYDLDSPELTDQEILESEVVDDSQDAIVSDSSTLTLDSSESDDVKDPVISSYDQAIKEFQEDPDVPEKTEELPINNSNQGLTDEEKEMTDITKLFNANK